MHFTYYYRPEGRGKWSVGYYNPQARREWIPITTTISEENAALMCHYLNSTLKTTPKIDKTKRSKKRKKIKDILSKQTEMRDLDLYNITYNTYGKKGGCDCAPSLINGNWYYMCDYHRGMQDALAEVEKQLNERE